MDAVGDQVRFSGKDIPEHGNIVSVATDGSGYTFLPAQKCQDVFKDSFDIKEVEDEAVMHFTSEQSYQSALGASYQAVRGSLGLDTSKYYTFHATLVDGQRAVPKKQAYNDFLYCCSVRPTFCQDKGESYVSETGAVAFDVEEYEKIDIKAEVDPGTTIFTAQGKFQRTARETIKQRLNYFRVARLPEVEEPDATREVTISPLRVFYHAIDDIPATEKGFLHLSISNARRPFYTVTLTPVSPQQLKIEGLSDELKPSDTYQSVVTFTCRDLNAEKSCATTLGVQVNPVNPGPSLVAVDVVDRFAGSVAQPYQHAIEVIKKTPPGSNTIQLATPPEVDLTNALSQTVKIQADAPSIAASESVFVIPIHTPPGLGVRVGPCVRKAGTVTFECNIDFSRPPTPGQVPSDIVVLGVSRSNVSSLVAPLTIVVRLPPPPPAAPLPPPDVTIP